MCTNFSSTFGAFVLAALLVVSARAATPNAYAPLGFQPLGNHGQALVDMEMTKHPELKLVAIHVTLPGVPAAAVKGPRYMMFSSFGRIGQPDGAELLEFVQSKTERSRVATDLPAAMPSYRVMSHPNYKVQTPLLNRAGEVIGFTVTVFPYQEGADLKAYDAIAHAVRDDFQQQISDKDDLYQPAK
ncbi:MAG: hypothetical protein JWM32_1044 [Verrucomicrobia bacterium]|nr:hypothetical protein [Verrucomicrobiota bacterium]